MIGADKVDSTGLSSNITRPVKEPTIELGVLNE